MKKKTYFHPIIDISALLEEDILTGSAEADSDDMFADEEPTQE